VPAVAVVLLSTLTTTFLDIYSNAVSAQSLFPKLGTRGLVLLGGLAGTLIALFFDATQYEGFLLFIGSAFCPLFGVVLADYFLLKRGHYVAEDLYRRGRYWYTGGVNVRGMAAWAVGFGIYHWCARTGFAGGASIPAMVLAAALYLLISHNAKGSK
jgi:purine-cytosine permease-like protein